MERLTDEDMDKIAKKTVQILRDDLYQEVGKSVLSKLFYIIGACAVGLYVYFDKFSH